LCVVQHIPDDRHALGAKPIDDPGDVLSPFRDQIDQSDIAAGPRQEARRGLAHPLAATDDQRLPAGEAEQRCFLGHGFPPIFR
jgi:hypothetical protein